MGSPPRPRWLPTSGPGQLLVAPERWAMSIEQWAAFLMSCQLHEDLWRELQDSADRKKQGYVNLYQLNDHFVKPWTRNMGNGVALLMNSSQPVEAQLMISHAWGEGIVETMIALFGKASASGIALATPIWFCIFAQYQAGDEVGDCGPGIAKQLALDPFVAVIGSKPIYGMLVVHTSRAEPYDRLWCVHEMDEAHDANIATYAGCSTAYLVGVTRGDFSLQVDTANARCYVKADEERLRAQILQGIGFEALDAKVMQIRMASLKKMMLAVNMLTDYSSSKLHMNFADFVEYLEPCMKSSAQWVGSACLLRIARQLGHEEEYVKPIMRMARALIDQIEPKDMMLGALPPMLDQSKCCMDAGVYEMLRQSDQALLDALSDLRTFMQPLAHLELGAGGAAVGLIRDPLLDIFRKHDKDGSGTIPLVKLKRIIQIIDPTWSQDTLQRLLSVLDRNGQVDYAEFVSYCRDAYWACS